MTTKNTCFIIFFIALLKNLGLCSKFLRRGGRVGWGKGKHMSFGQKGRGRTSIILLKPPQPLPLRGPCQLDTGSFSFLGFEKVKVGLNQTKQVFLTMIKFTLKPSKNTNRWWASIGGVIERVFHAAYMYGLWKSIPGIKSWHRQREGISETFKNPWNSSSLVVTPINDTEFTSYTCIATNKMGSDQLKFILKEKGWW